MSALLVVVACGQDEEGGAAASLPERDVDDAGVEEGGGAGGAGGGSSGSATMDAGGEEPSSTMDSGEAIDAGSLEPSSLRDGGGTNGGETDGGGTDDGELDPCDDLTCEPGTVCSGGECVPGCSADAPCGMGFTCCGGQCFDISSDDAHCGGCDDICAPLPNQLTSCQEGICTVGECLPGFFDCDGQASTGCERSEECVCVPGVTQPCYPGPPGTEGVGECVAGLSRCNDSGTGFEPCEGFVIPSAEQCNTGRDEDCNGTVDDVPDLDGDGWTICDGDCCETEDECSNPALVNPGAFEVVGNGVDDDCDPSTSDDEPAPLCSGEAKLTDVSAVDLAHAMDICQTTTHDPPLPERKWGLISAEFRLPDGSAPAVAELSNMQNLQTAVRLAYGTGGVVPEHGATMAALSNGVMRTEGEPGYSQPNPGTDFESIGEPPEAYLAAHGGALPASAGCSGACLAGSGAYDGVNLRLQIRVPTNALSFSFSFRFFSAEYWSWACSEFNDFFLTQLDTGASGIPSDRNITFDAMGNPMSVNNGYFEVCEPNGCHSCPSGTPALASTGMHLVQGGGVTGGGTTWLRTTAPVVPGEIMTLELMIFDVSDGTFDSIVLLDAFEWGLDPSGVGTAPAGG